MMTLNHPARDEAATSVATKPIHVSKKWVAHVLTFLMVFGPGLIVMEADNDAGAVSTYAGGYLLLMFGLLAFRVLQPAGAIHG